VEPFSCRFEALLKIGHEAREWLVCEADLLSQVDRKVVGVSDVTQDPSVQELREVSPAPRLKDPSLFGGL
jgi:hypothetical protein